jgi:hypothetical protein
MNSFPAKSGFSIAPQSRRLSKAAALIAAVTVAVASTASVSADITGFGGFGPVNTYGVPAGGISGDGATFQLTNGGDQAASAFFATPQAFGSIWEADFTYSTQDGADGFTFLFQKDPLGLTARGGSGGSLGYTAGTGGAAISPSAAYAVNIYNTDSAGLLTNGNPGTLAALGQPYFSTTGVQQPINFKLSYAGGKLTATIRNPNNLATSNPTFNITSYALDLAGTVGGPTAYIGFTGGSGGAPSTQTIGGFKFRSAVGSSFTPLTLSGFNADPVVDIGSNPAASTNTSLDGGTAKTGNTFYAKGQNPGSLNQGLPMGTTFASLNDTAHTFTLGAANANNALFLDRVTPQRLTLASPGAYEALSFLATTGSGAGVYTATINFTDGSPAEVITGALSPDWFNAGGFALDSLGRIDQNSNYDQTGTTGNPRLYQQDFLLSNRTSPISSIDFLQTAGGSGGANTFVFGVSGVVAVPEPSALCALALGATVALARRSRGKRA